MGLKVAPEISSSGVHAIKVLAFALLQDAILGIGTPTTMQDILHYPTCSQQITLGTCSEHVNVSAICCNWCHEISLEVPGM